MAECAEPIFFSTKGAISSLKLEVSFIPPTGQQERAIEDALHLLASWAIRAARKGEETAPAADLAAISPLTSGAGEVMNVAGKQRLRRPEHGASSSTSL